MDYTDPQAIVSCDVEDPRADEGTVLARSRYVNVSRLIDRRLSRSRGGTGRCRCDHEPGSGPCILSGKAAGAPCRSGARDGLLLLQQCGDCRTLCSEKAWSGARVDCRLGCAPWQWHAA